MDNAPHFFILSSFTPVALQPLIDAMAPVPEEFPREYFIEGETIFGQEIESDPFLVSLYKSTYKLASDSLGMPEWAHFWPSRADLRQILRLAPFAENLESMYSFIQDRFPQADALIHGAQLAFVQSQMNRMRDYVPALASRYFLGKRVLDELPSLDRSLHQKLLEAPFRSDISEDAMALVVGDMAIRVGQTNSDVVDPSGIPMQAMLAGLQRAHFSNWADSATAVESGKGVFCLLPKFFGSTQTPLGELLSPEAVPACYRPGPSREQALIDADGPDLAVVNYILENMGIGSLTRSEVKVYDRVIARTDDRTREMIQYEAMLSLILGYLQSLARFAFISGYLDRRCSSGVGILRTYQRSYVPTFVTMLEDIFKEGLGDSALLNGSCVFRLAIDRLWAFFVARRERLPFGLTQDWDKFRSYADVIREQIRTLGDLSATPTREHEGFPVSGERVDVRSLFGGGSGA